MTDERRFVNVPGEFLQLRHPLSNGADAHQAQNVKDKQNRPAYKKAYQKQEKQKCSCQAARDNPHIPP
jgi:hypothetical protein